MRWIAIAILSCLLTQSGCTKKSDTTARSGKPTVAAVNYPLAYFAGELAGAGIDVYFPCPAEEDPEFWKPSAEVIAAYQQADLIFLNGAGYAAWTETASLPIAKCVQTAAGFEKQYIQREDAITHNHGPGGEHTHRGLVGQTWLDPMQAKEQMQAISAALVLKFPQRKEDIQARAAELSRSLDALHKEFEAAVKPLEGEPLLASHPVYHYFNRRYNLKVQSVHWDADAMPDAAEWKAFDALRQKHPGRRMLWEEEPIEPIRKALEERGVEIIVFHTLGQKPDKGNWLTAMQENAKRLQQVKRTPGR